MTLFIGRDVEMNRLRQLTKKRSASLIIVKGRRRIGKSRLLQEFGKEMERTVMLSGLAPANDTTAASQRIEFSRQLERELGIKGVATHDWGDLFWHLSKAVETGQVLIVFDEITWMGSCDPSFLGKLKNAWDLYFSRNSQLILALSGSLSAWIEENILSSTGFFGRESLTLTLHELPLHVCKQFWTVQGIDVTPYEMLRFLSVTGGVPRYLEELDPTLSAEKNIQQLAFTEGGILFGEFEKIFSDLFSKRNALYQKIVMLLTTGSKTQIEITKLMQYASPSEIGEYLDELEKSGFIARDFTWNIQQSKHSSLSRYRLSDNYSRFYLKTVLPNKLKISRGDFHNNTVMILPTWDSIMGLQVENLVLNNHQKIKHLLNIPLAEIEIDGAFFQRKTQRQSGCQIDYMIQTKSHTLYICEIKFSRNTAGMRVVNEVKQKINNIKTPKQYFCRPVLIHMHGVSDEVLDSQYFSQIIDMPKLFEPLF
jgi:uncharacterized protein